MLTEDPYATKMSTGWRQKWTCQQSCDLIQVQGAASVPPRGRLDKCAIAQGCKTVVGLGCMMAVVSNVRPRGNMGAAGLGSGERGREKRESRRKGEQGERGDSEGGEEGEGQAEHKKEDRF